VEDEDDRESPFAVIQGYAAHAIYSAQARLRRLVGLPGRRAARTDFDEPVDLNDEEFGLVHEDDRRKPAPQAGAHGRIEPSMFGEPAVARPQPAPRRVVSAPSLDDDEPPFDMELHKRPAGILPDDEDDDDWAPLPDIRAPRAAPAATPPAAVAPARPQAAPRQEHRLTSESGTFDLPPLELLAEPKSIARDASLSTEALSQNARILEGVLEDFGVKGNIIHVRPGPVVTLYELEPAPGIKSSRVIGLADDIARSMSAIAARVAVVPGRNAIGIELPNRVREMVYFREMIGSRDFGQTKAKLAVALGKTIGGEPVVADLAKMPHLLVAGTTGSGKSVAINTMILSLVYRMTPEQCRLIMIDPKMLELSVYDGIPHLLSPVVTDPKKAVVALKWTVREMEERYKKMSKIGVRNIDGFNERVGKALEKGEGITRTVQTGFDRMTGEALYETEEFDLRPLPYIVVIIDEMADLMMVAGKDIEGAVQRLAQMARAAGIHVIMATQRPSVDVITGTIKANFPTRISFQVTSKIDSRTILGEQGAEQLLGQGDMLYMAGGGRIQRVHGPFVSDMEVEDVVAFLKSQGAPQYLDAITADDDEDGEGDSSGAPSGTGNLADSEDPYDQAVAVVLRDGKASTSYIQRRLGIGYNRAASIIERMEKEGLVGPANHAGKREILVPTEEDVLAR
jgi:DNA segregation ATPase FtsK/SpoIIIE, S-DNA-T family